MNTRPAPGTLNPVWLIIISVVVAIIMCAYCWPLWAVVEYARYQLEQSDQRNAPAYKTQATFRLTAEAYGDDRQYVYDQLMGMLKQTNMDSLVESIYVDPLNGGIRELQISFQVNNNSEVEARRSAELFVLHVLGAVKKINLMRDDLPNDKVHLRGNYTTGNVTFVEVSYSATVVNGTDWSRVSPEQVYDLGEIESTPTPSTVMSTLKPTHPPTMP